MLAPLFERFSRAAIDAGATVEQIPRSSTALASAIRRVTGEARRIAFANAIDLPSDLFEECRRAPNVVTARSRIELSSLDAGITEAFAGIARTGSVCVSVDHGEAGTISLLARMHIAVLASETIIERPADLFRPDCLGAKGLHRNFVFITGPSATADMGPLVRGVHGPHRLHLIVLA